MEQNVVAYLIQSGFMASFVDGATAGLIFLIALTIACVIPTWIVATHKGRSGLWWASLALTLPLIPLLLVWLLPSLPTHE